MEKNERCNCGHMKAEEHFELSGACKHGCAKSFCETGEPELREGVVEQLDEDGIPWLGLIFALKLLLAMACVLA